METAAAVAVVEIGSEIAADIDFEIGMDFGID